MKSVLILLIITINVYASSKLQYRNVVIDLESFFATCSKELEYLYDENQTTISEEYNDLIFYQAHPEKMQLLKNILRNPNYNILMVIPIGFPNLGNKAVKLLTRNNPKLSKYISYSMTQKNADEQIVLPKSQEGKEAIILTDNIEKVQDKDKRYALDIGKSYSSLKKGVTVPQDLLEKLKEDKFKETLGNVFYDRKKSEEKTAKAYAIFLNNIEKNRPLILNPDNKFDTSLIEEGMKKLYTNIEWLKENNSIIGCVKENADKSYQENLSLKMCESKFDTNYKWSLSTTPSCLLETRDGNLFIRQAEIESCVQSLGARYLYTNKSYDTCGMFTQNFKFIKNISNNKCNNSNKGIICFENNVCIENNNLSSTKDRKKIITSKNRKRVLSYNGAKIKNFKNLNNDLYNLKTLNINAPEEIIKGYKFPSYDRLKFRSMSEAQYSSKNFLSGLFGDHSIHTSIESKIVTCTRWRLKNGKKCPLWSGGGIGNVENYDLYSEIKKQVDEMREESQIYSQMNDGQLSLIALKLVNNFFKENVSKEEADKRFSGAEKEYEDFSPALVFGTTYQESATRSSYSAENGYPNVAIIQEQNPNGIDYAHRMNFHSIPTGDEGEYNRPLAYTPNEIVGLYLPSQYKEAIVRVKVKEKIYGVIVDVSENSCIIFDNNNIPIACKSKYYDKYIYNQILGYPTPLTGNEKKLKAKAFLLLDLDKTTNIPLDVKKLFRTSSKKLSPDVKKRVQESAHLQTGNIMLLLNK